MSAANLTFDDCVPESSNVCCVSEHSKTCVSLPEFLDGFLLVLWPRAPHSESDCACSLFYPSGPPNNLIVFEDCYCLKLHLTVYNVTLNPSEQQLCWNDLTRATNDTKVVFVRDKFETDRTAVRIFQSETRITVEGN